MTEFVIGCWVISGWCTGTTYIIYRRMWWWNWVTVGLMVAGMVLWVSK